MKITRVFSEVLGWLCGDGYIYSGLNKKGSRYFRADAYFNKQEYESSITPFQELLKEDSRFSYSVKEHKGVQVVQLNTLLSKQVIYLFRGTPQAWEKFIPSEVLSSSILLTSFLRGLFSSDGWVRTSDRLLGLTTTSERLAKEVQVSLLTLGVHSTLKSQFHKKGYSKTLGREIVPKRRVYEILVCGNSYDKFFSQIGFNNWKQRQYLNKGKAKTRVWEGYSSDVITKIERVTSQKFYGCEIEGHVYTTNGFVTHNTPLYYMPRKSTALAWKSFFSKVDGKDFYFYPWMYLSDLGVKVKDSSQPKDTIIQQSLQDCPHEFLEDIWLKPILSGKFDNFSTDMVLALREGFQKYGLTPRGQFLEFDGYKSSRQHLAVGAGAPEQLKKIRGKGTWEGVLDYSKTSGLNGTGCCLKTPATEWKKNQATCIGCDFCKDVDNARKECGFEVKEMHVKWMHNRPLNTKYNLMDVKTALMVNSASFYYQCIFKISDEGRYIAKETLIRRWLSLATDFDESLVKNFRTISSALFKSLDYEGLISTYAGYEICKLGFKDALDMKAFQKIIDQVNALPEAAPCQLVSIQETNTQSGCSNYTVLTSIDVMADTEEVHKFISHFTEEHRLYEGSTSMPETFAQDFKYKVMKSKGCYRILFLKKPRWNTVWSDGLKKWTANKVNDKLKNDKVWAIFQTTGDGRLVDLMTNKVFETSGFIDVHQQGNDFVEKEEAGVDVDGA